MLRIMKNISGQNHMNRRYRRLKIFLKYKAKLHKAIASELKATITPEEKQLIEKIPTTNLTAYDFYQRGKEETCEVSMA